jgi:hypothetical protein
MAEPAAGGKQRLLVLLDAAVPRGDSWKGVGKAVARVANALLTVQQCRLELAYGWTSSSTSVVEGMRSSKLPKREHLASGRWHGRTAADGFRVGDAVGQPSTLPPSPPSAPLCPALATPAVFSGEPFAVGYGDRELDHLEELMAVAKRMARGPAPTGQAGHGAHPGAAAKPGGPGGRERASDGASGVEQGGVGCAGAMPPTSPHAAHAHAACPSCRPHAPLAAASPPRPAAPACQPASPPLHPHPLPCLGLLAGNASLALLLKSVNLQVNMQAGLLKSSTAAGEPGAYCVVPVRRAVLCSARPSCCA